MRVGVLRHAAVPLWSVMEATCPLEAAHVADVMQLHCAWEGDWHGWAQWAEAALQLLPRLHAVSGCRMEASWASG